MRRLRLTAWVVVIAGALFAGTPRFARADDQDQRAVDLFEQSEAAYYSGHFAEAVLLLRQSYELKKEPVLLYNLGRAYEGLGDLAAAARSYEAFLLAQPDAQDRGALERRVLTLRQQLAEREALKRRALEGDASRPPRAPRAMPWVIAGVGAAGIVSGAIVRVFADRRNDDARNEPTYIEAERLHSQAETLAAVANVCFIAGSIVVAGGVIWGVVDVAAAKTRRATSAHPRLILAF
jgi:tetratricopeptide (TPR) repeat protein